jgi:hypothetical protein
MNTKGKLSHTKGIGAQLHELSKEISTAERNAVTRKANMLP